MRDRPFLPASEAPRPYSEVRAERDAGDTDGLIRERTLKRIAAIEAEACELVDPAARKRLLCEAEAMRSALYELPRRTA